MKKFSLCLLVVFIATGCLKNDPELQVESSSESVVTRASGDNVYDLLGYGYDVTGEFGPRSATYPVFDVMTLVQEHSDVFYKNIYRTTTQDYTSGTNVGDLTRKLGAKISSSNPLTAQSDEISSALGITDTSSVKYNYTYVSTYSETFATYGSLFKELDLDANIDLLVQYLSPQFKLDRDRLSPSDLIKKYGTHVLANVYLGGVLKLFYHSKASSTNSQVIHEAGFKLTSDEVLGFSFGGSYSTSDAKKNSQEIFKVTSVGGEGSLSISMNIDTEGKKSYAVSAENWLKSISENTSVMIGANKNKVYPIYEFVAESQKEAVKKAYDDYLRSKTFKVVNTAIQIAFRQVEGLGNANQGAGTAVLDINKNGKPDIILMGNNNATPNSFWYWVVYDVDSDGQNWSRQSGKFVVPKTFSNTNAGAAIAVGDINRNGNPDILFMALDKNGSKLSFRYVIGWDIKADGSCSSYSDIVKINSDMGTRADGAGAALYDIDGNGRLDLVLMQYDAPSGGQDQFRYRIYYNLSNNGTSWERVSNKFYVPLKFGTAADGAGVTVGNLDSDPQPEIILTAYDDPDGMNNFRYMVLHNVDATGNPASITPYYTYRGAGNSGAGADAQLCDIDGNGIPDMIFMCIDDSSPNRFRYILGHDLNAKGELGYIR